MTFAAPSCTRSPHLQQRNSPFKSTRPSPISLTPTALSMQTRRKLASRHNNNRWLSPEAIEAKRFRYRLERKWRFTKVQQAYIAYRRACREANMAIMTSRCSYYSRRINEAGRDPRKRWSAIRDALHQSARSEAVAGVDCQALCSSFSSYFTTKISLLKDAINNRPNGAVCDPTATDTLYTGQLLDQLQPPSVDEVARLISSMPASHHLLTQYRHQSSNRAVMSSRLSSRGWRNCHSTTAYSRHATKLQRSRRC
jgi:hypothetical protein